MAMTLIEAAKLNSGDVQRAGVIEMFARSTDILRVLPFEDIPGGSLSYQVEGKLPGVAFRGFNEAYAEGVGIINQAVEVLRIAGGDLDVDKALIKTRGERIREVHIAMKVKAMGLYLTKKFIKGDSEDDPREMDGIQKRITGSQLIGRTLSASTDGALSLEALDAAIDAVDEPTHLIMSKAMRRKFTVAARNSSVGGEISFSLDEFGKRVTTYNGLPILIVDYDDTGTRILDFNEVGPSASTAVCQSIYVVSFGGEKLIGLQNGTMEVNDLGEIDSKPVLRTRIEWLFSFAAMHGRCASRIYGITNVAFTA